MQDIAESSAFKTDYAASDRSTCGRCRKPIPKSDLRMAPMVQSTAGDFKYPVWHHFSCFEDGYLKKHPGALHSVSQVSGVDSLRFEDQKRVKSLVVGGDSSLETKAVTDEEKRIAAESKLLWSRKEQLEKLSDAELKDLLTHNRQPCVGKIFGGRGKMIDRAADAMIFGALPKCTVCKNGDFVFSHGEYKCVGAMDEFAKCENRVSSIHRNPFLVPKELGEEHDFLRRFRFKERERAVAAISATNPNAAAAASANQSGLEAPDAVREKRARGDPEPLPSSTLQPFQGYAVMFVGKLSKKQTELEAVICQHGGVVAKSVGAASVCVCTPTEATGNGTQKGKDAVAKGMLCLSEQWVLDSVAAGHRLPGSALAPYVLANPKVEDGERLARLVVAEKIEQEAEAKAQRQQLEEKYSEAPPTKKSRPEVKRIVVKGNCAVEPDSGLAEDGHIFQGTNGDTYNSTMNLTDVTTGKNSFYILQLIEHDTSKTGKFTVFRKWGRLGEDGIGGTKSTDYPSVEPAVREFQKVFLDKTGNDWTTRKSSFKKMFGKFMPIEIDYSANNDGSASSQLNTAGYTGTLPKATQDFVSLIFDIKAMTAAMQEMEIDTQKMPLGKLSKETIREGFAALKELQQIVEGKHKETDEFTPAQRTRLVSLTNKFYTFIPHVMPVGAASRGLLDSLELIKTKVELLTQLQDLEIASKMISSASGDSDGATQHPIDKHYQSLKADMSLLDSKSEEFRRLDAYLQNTHGSTHTTYSLELLDAWAVERDGEAARFEPFKDDPNRMLLWHGSRLTNWGGIISQGLRIAPPEAPSTGYMFGKGVYFADMSSKSANYCFTTSEKTAGVLMLCEVALGQQYKLKRAEFVDGLKKPFLSTFGMGKNHPNPKEAFHEDSGCVIPMGHGEPSGINDTTLLYNEFIVYNVAQIKTRYVLRVNFKYHKKAGTFF
jgi:hypothetical protein